MTKEQKQEFTRRVTQANRSELVVLKFEILSVYLEDAKDAYGSGDAEAFKVSVRHADDVLKSLEDTLDLKYEISRQLYSLYDFHRRQLAKAIYRHSIQEVEESMQLLKSTQEAFVKVAQQDTSEPLMRNAQQVYAGFTYGKKDLNESYTMEQSRGFLA